MSAFTDTGELDILKKIFQATALPWDGITSIYLSLHTADPGETGSQTTSEATYTGYARVAVARNGTGWTVVSNAIRNASAVSFPACTGGSNTITHIGIGTDSTGGGTLLFKGAIGTPLSVSSGITPTFAAQALVVSLD